MRIFQIAFVIALIAVLSRLFGKRADIDERQVPQKLAAQLRYALAKFGLDLDFDRHDLLGRLVSRLGVQSLQDLGELVDEDIEKLALPPVYRKKVLRMINKLQGDTGKQIVDALIGKQEEEERLRLEQEMEMEVEKERKYAVLRSKQEAEAEREKRKEENSSKEKEQRARKVAAEEEIQQYAEAQKHFGKENFVKAQLLFNQLAERGHAGAQNYLAICFVKGQDASLENHVKAMNLFRLSADQGNMLAQYNLANMLYFGKAGQKKIGEAVHWYQLSAEQGLGLGQCKLGKMFLNGQGVKQDFKKAMKWLMLSAEQGNACGQFALGSVYENGLGVHKDITAASAWYRKAEGYKEANDVFHMIV